MEFTEFKEKVEELFSDLEISDEYDKQSPDYFINKEKTIELIIGLKNIELQSSQQRIYKSSIYDDFENFYDELIIFKELILPKYQ